MEQITQQYRLWLEKATEDPDLVEELKALKQDPDRLEDAFYQNLTFGTGGLRGVIGAGTNRMNLYTVAWATQGLAYYIRKNSSGGEAPKVAVAYDSRIKSYLFAQTTCEVLAANGLQVFLYPQLMPTPCLSFAVRELGCFAGVMITASHNPSSYNGYKVYGSDGCQITSRAAAEILQELQTLDLFSSIHRIPFEDGVRGGSIRMISETVSTLFIQAVKNQSLWKTEESHQDLSVVYSPLNGTGLQPVLRALLESGYTNVTVVEEQRLPDGNFPTCPSPNPEVKEAMSLGIRYAKARQADLFLATDPDCDRVGVAAKGTDGQYVLLSGNETGMLLLDYLCARHRACNTMPKDPIFMKTIVTAGMAERIASHYGVHTVNVLTGFKYIGEQLGILEAEGREGSFVFAFEESCGYLSGSYVRDKDGVAASLLICEMAAFYRRQGLTLPGRLEELYRAYGYCLDTQHSYHFEGALGASNMRQVMDRLRRVTGRLGGKKIIGFLDYQEGLDGLPKSDVLRFLLEDHGSVVVRPSGTEPKLKVYLSACGKSREDALKTEEQIAMGVSQEIRNTKVNP